MSYALIGLCVMSIVVMLSAVLRILSTNRHVRHLVASYAQHLARSAGAGGSSSIVLGSAATGEGWALIDRALRARSTVRFDVR